MVSSEPQCDFGKAFGLDMTTGSDLHQSVPFSPSLPAVAQCEPVRAYKLGQYTAFIVSSPPTLLETTGKYAGIVEYVYAMSVSPAEPPHTPVLYVTAEKTRQGSRSSDHTYLCVFDAVGRKNTGVVPNLHKLEVFSAQAVSVARDKLKISDQPVELQIKAAASSSGCMSVIALVAVPVIFMTVL